MMKTKKIILLCCFSLSLSACYKNRFLAHEKPVDYPQTTRSGIHYTADKTDLRRMSWWKKLKDPKLDLLITKALVVNNSIKGAYATIEEAQAQLKAAQYAWIPTLDASANGFSAQAWNTNITPNLQILKNPLLANSSLAQTHPSNLRFRGYYTGFTPGYTFNILYNISNIKSAKASLAVQEAQTQSTKLGIISQMSGTYFMLLSQRQQLAVEHALVQDLKKLRQLEHVRFQKGASDIETVISMNQQLAQEEAKIPQIVSVITQSENTIHLLLNENPGPIATQRDVLTLNTERLIPQDLPSSVLKNRPDVLLDLNNLKIAEAQIGMAFSAFFPSISLTGLLGSASLDLSHIANLSTKLWFDRAAASMSILNASSYQNIKSAQARLKTAYYDYLQTLRAAFADVDNQLTNAHQNKISYLQAQKGYTAARQTYSIALTQYKAGAKDYRSVLNAKVAAERSKLSVIQEKAQVLDSIVQVYTSVAGGYATN